MSMFLAGVFLGSLLTSTVWLIGITSDKPAKMPLRKKFAKVTINETRWIPKPNGIIDYDPSRPNKIQGIKRIRAVTGFGLKESKEMTEGKSYVLPREQADTLATQLQEMEVEVSIVPQRKLA